MNNLIKAKLALLPDQPGCYLMKNAQGQIIYVGKAKVLKNRVRSYFTGSHDTKTTKLVSEINDFEYIITESNTEALVLEINLIQKNQPKYNILLKDDKSYPYLKITNERYPRLLITRKILKDKATYFGPYPDVRAANETKKILDRIYPLRKCHVLPKKVCLYYHMGQCLAPCVYEVDKEAYQGMIAGIRHFVNGGYQDVQKEIQLKMERSAEEYDFEQAAEYRDQIAAISSLMTRQKMTNVDMKNRDVFGYSVDKGWMCVQVFYIRQGKMIKRDASSFPIYNEPEEDFLTFIGSFYTNREQLVPKEVLIPDRIDAEQVAAVVPTKIIQPKRGDKKQLVALANKNAMAYLEEQFALKIRQQERTIGAIEGLGKAMGIEPPRRIEAFDNSNIMGTAPVSAMIAFIDGKPAKTEYRKYKIKTVVGPDDYASMREVIYRRYSRVLKEGLPLPDLIIIDGGKGQIEAAREVLEDQLGLTIPLAGLAKDERHRTSELLFGAGYEPVVLPRNSEEFYLLQRIQDEVHRFAITFHRQVRSKNSFASRLDEVPGLGPKRKKILLQKFKSLKKIQEASISDLQAVGIPVKVAEAILDRLQEK